MFKIQSLIRINLLVIGLKEMKSESKVFRTIFNKLRNFVPQREFSETFGYRYAKEFILKNIILFPEKSFIHFINKGHYNKHINMYSNRGTQSSLAFR